MFQWVLQLGGKRWVGGRGSFMGGEQTRDLTTLTLRSEEKSIISTHLHSDTHQTEKLQVETSDSHSEGSLHIKRFFTVW